MKQVSALVVGIIFGLGLSLSHMVDPDKVINFLDLFGHWDASLAFVMGGAILVTFPGYRWVLGRKKPLFEQHFHLPTDNRIDASLMFGAALFGLGWGLSGYCPGPAVAALTINPHEAFIFIPAMIAGGLAARWLRGSPTSEAATS